MIIFWLIQLHAPDGTNIVKINEQLCSYMKYVAYTHYPWWSTHITYVLNILHMILNDVKIKVSKSIHD